MFMMETKITFILICIFVSRLVTSEKVGPAVVIKNDVQQSNSGPVRTTTVYGFLDFTTTIDNTVVVFRPSSASVKSSHTVDISSSKSIGFSQLATLASTQNSKTRQIITASVTLNPDRQPSNKGSIIKIDRDEEKENGKVTPAISPTPTIARGGNSVGSTRRMTSSSLTEKRRRFLAQVRRQRPTVPSGSSSPLPSKSGLIAMGPQTDQEMAESIEVAPSKIKRFQSLSNYNSSLYTLPNSGMESRPGRILVRKLQRRLGRQPVETLDKNRHVMAIRRPSSKLALLSLSNPRKRDHFAQAGVELASSLNLVSSSSDAFSNSEAASSSSDLNTVSSGMLSGSPSDGHTAIITEYVHDGTELGSESGPLQSSIVPSADEDGKVVRESNDLSLAERKDHLTESDLLVSSLIETPSDPESISPITVLKSSHSNNKTVFGLTVPLQLSIVTSVFSLTETRLRTSLLPVYDGTSTTYYTLTHSFVVTKTVTTFQTVPPEEYMHYLIPGNDSYHSLNDILPEFNSLLPPPHSLQRKSDVENDANEPEDESHNESEELLENAGSINLDVESNDQKEEAKGNPDSSLTTNPATNPALMPQMGQPPPVNPLLGNLPFLNLLGPAAALGLNPYFPYGLGLPQVITTSRPVFSTDVIYTSKFLPIIDGLTTTYRTLHEAASTVTRTSYETFTTQVANGNPLAGLAANSLQPAGPQAMSTVTSPVTLVTTETETATQVFKLMYDGYKTSYRTVSSTSLVTRTITTYTTTTVPMYNTMLPFFG